MAIKQASEAARLLGRLSAKACREELGNEKFLRHMRELGKAGGIAKWKKEKSQ